MIASFTGDYAFLSNFWPAPVVLDGLEYPTVEHAYQAAKTLDPAQRLKIRLAPTAGKAKRLGQKVKLRKDWTRIKDSTMLLLLRRKFQIPQLRRLLEATAGQRLSEGNTWGDTYWGVCDGVGEDKLGKLLMRVRDEDSEH